jgi:alpha-glucosidase
MAGFTRGRPWLRLSADHSTKNVEAEEHDAESILNLYRRLIALRRGHSVLVSGALRSVTVSGNLLSYERVADSERLLIFLNFGHNPVRAATERGLVIADTGSHRNMEQADGFIELQGSEGLIIVVSP